MADDTDKAEPSAPTCLADPNFAVICSFLDKFAVQVGIPSLPFTQLQEMLEDQDQVSQALTDLHVKLLRKARKSFTLDKWEKALTKFAHSYSQQDGWELERFGYKKASLGVKLRLLKTLLEAQFDVNNKFKNEVNKLTPQELRVEPLGKDQDGLVYWCQFDPACNVRVYREDTDEENWDLVAQDRVGLVKLIDGLSSGEGQQTLNMILEEEAALEAEKPITDTGQDDEAEGDEEENEDEEPEGEEDEEDVEEEEEEEQSGDDEGNEGSEKPKRETSDKISVEEETTKNEGAEDKPGKDTKAEEHDAEPVKVTGEKSVERELPKPKSLSKPENSEVPENEATAMPKPPILIVEKSVSKVEEKANIVTPSRPTLPAAVSSGPTGPKETVLPNGTNDKRPRGTNGSLDLSARPPAKLGHRPGSRLEEIFKMKMDRPVNPYPEDKTSILSQMAARFNSPEEAAEDLSAPAKKPRLDDSVKNGASHDEPEPIVGEAIEESVMVVQGEGSGADCNAGNPSADYDSNTAPDLEVIAIFNATSEESVREALRECIISDAESNKPADTNGVSHKSETTKRTSSCGQDYEKSEINILNEMRIINASNVEKTKQSDSDSNIHPSDSSDPKEFVFEVSDVIEEDVMYFSGCGAGHDCDTGNPNEPSSEKPSTSEESRESEKKTKKLWSIEAICKPSDSSKSETKSKLDDPKKNGPGSDVPLNTLSVVDKREDGVPTPVEKPNIPDAPEPKPSIENGQDLVNVKEKPPEPPQKSVFLSNLIEHCLVNKAENKVGIGDEPPAGDKYEDLFSAKNILGPSSSVKPFGSSGDKIQQDQSVTKKKEVLSKNIVEPSGSVKSVGSSGDKIQQDQPAAKKIEVSPKNILTSSGSVKSVVGDEIRQGQSANKVTEVSASEPDTKPHVSISKQLAGKKVEGSPSVPEKSSNPVAPIKTMAQEDGKNKEAIVKEDVKPIENIINLRCEDTANPKKGLEKKIDVAEQVREGAKSDFITKEFDENQEEMELKRAGSLKDAGKKLEKSRSEVEGQKEEKPTEPNPSTEPKLASKKMVDAPRAESSKVADVRKLEKPEKPIVVGTISVKNDGIKNQTALCEENAEIKPPDVANLTSKKPVDHLCARDSPAEPDVLLEKGASCELACDVPLKDARASSVVKPSDVPVSKTQPKPDKLLPHEDGKQIKDVPGEPIVVEKSGTKNGEPNQGSGNSANKDVPSKPAEVKGMKKIDKVVPSKPVEVEEMKKIDKGAPSEPSEVKEIKEIVKDAPSKPPEEKDVKKIDRDVPCKPAEVEGLKKIDKDVPSKPVEVEELKKIDKGAPSEPSEVKEIKEIDKDAPSKPDEEKDVKKIDRDAPSKPAEVKEMTKIDKDAPSKPAKVKQIKKIDKDVPFKSAEKKEVKKFDKDVPSKPAGGKEVKKLDKDVLSKLTEVKEIDKDPPSKPTTVKEMKKIEKDVPFKPAEGTEVKKPDKDVLSKLTEVKEIDKDPPSKPTTVKEMKKIEKDLFLEPAEEKELKKIDKDVPSKPPGEKEVGKIDKTVPSKPAKVKEMKQIDKDVPCKPAVVKEVKKVDQKPDDKQSPSTTEPTIVHPKLAEKLDEPYVNKKLTEPSVGYGENPKDKSVAGNPIVDSNPPEKRYGLKSAGNDIAEKTGKDGVEPFDSKKTQPENIRASVDNVELVGKKKPENIEKSVEKANVEPVETKIIENTDKSVEKPIAEPVVKKNPTIEPVGKKNPKTKPRIGPKSKMAEWAKAGEKSGGGNWLMQMQGMVDNIEKYEPDQKEHPKQVAKETLKSTVKTESKPDVKIEPVKDLVKEPTETKKDIDTGAVQIKEEVIPDVGAVKAKSEEITDVKLKVEATLKSKEKSAPESSAVPKKEVKSDSEKAAEKPKGRKSRTNSLNDEDEVPPKVRKTESDKEPKEAVPRKATRRTSRAASLSKAAEVEDKKAVETKKNVGVEAEVEEKAEEVPAKKVFSLSSFSLEEPLEDLHKTPPIKTTPPAPPAKGGKRKRGAPAGGKSEEEITDADESKAEQDEEEEVGGKKPRLRGKVKRGGKRRKGRGGFRGKKESPTDQDSKAEDNKLDASNKAELANEPSKDAQGEEGGEESKDKDSEDDVPLAKRGRGGSKADKEAPKTDQKEQKPKRRPKKTTLLGLTEADLKSVASTPDTPSGMRTSRRIAMLKIKEEAEKRQIEEAIKQIEKGDKKKKDTSGKGNKDASRSSKKDKTKDTPGKGKRKKKNESDDDEEEESVPDDRKDGKHRKKKKGTKFNVQKFNTGNPWASSSDDEDENVEEEEEDHLEFMGMDDDDVVGKDVSDHEFSCDEDLEKGDDAEYLPVKRARTAVRKEKGEKKEDEAEAAEDDLEDYKCEKCGAGDHPEWILLCDTCDKGYHASCLRPPLMLIPEGDWFCPPCSHASLVKKLKDVLRTFERNTKKRENEELRRKRLAYVGISLANVLPDSAGNKGKKEKKPKRREVEEDDRSCSEDSRSSRSGSSSGGSESGSSEASDEEPIYQLRQRRSAAQNYRFNDYDQLIDSAIQDEMVAAGTAPLPGTEGVPASNGEPAPAATETGEGGAATPAENGKVPESKVKGGEEEDGEEKAEDDEEEGDISKGWRPPVVPRRPPPTFSGRRKPKKLCNLDVESDDQNDSDEDFKGSDSDEEEEDFSASTDESGDYRRSRQPVRRSGRARQSRVDKDFINDDSDDDDDYGPKSKKKKKKQVWDDSESSDSDRSWGRRKKRTATRSSFSKAKSRSKKKKSKRYDSDSDAPKKKSKSKKPKIRYGLSEDDEDDGPLIKTRGKKINYTEFHGSDTEEEERLNRIKGRKTLSDMEAEDEEFVLDKDEEEEFMGGKSQFRKAPRRISSGDDDEDEEDEDATSKSKSDAKTKPKEESEGMKTTPAKPAATDKPKAPEKKTDVPKPPAKNLPPASQPLPASKPKPAPLSRKAQQMESDEEAEEEEDEEEELEDEQDPEEEEEEEEEEGESEEEKPPVRQIPPPVPSLKARIPGRPPPTIPPIGVPSMQSKLKEALSAGAAAATPPLTLSPVRPKESEALTRLREKLAATAVRPPVPANPTTTVGNPVAKPLEPTPAPPVAGPGGSPVKIKQEEEEKAATPPPHAPGSIRVVNTAKLLAQPIQEQMKRVGPPESVIRGMLGGPPPGGPHGPPPMFYNRPPGPPPRGLPPGMDPGRYMQRPPLHPAAHHLQHQQRRFPDRFMYGPSGGYGGGYYPPAPYPPQEVRPVPVPADYEPPMAADDEPAYAPAAQPQPDGPGEFGGLVSYFSSQREEEAELDT